MANDKKIHTALKHILGVLTTYVYKQKRNLYTMNGNFFLVQQNIHAPATRLNSAFFQLLTGNYKPWFYENFINIVSYEKSGQHIIDFLDNRESVFESRIQTTHVYSFDELSKDDFDDFIFSSLRKNLYINLWCDEYFIPQSIRFQRHHFVHPLTVYGNKNETVYCEFFSISIGMSLIELDILSLKNAFYSINEYYSVGAGADILNVAISTYSVKEYTNKPFDLSVFTQELSYYYHGQVNPNKERDLWINDNNVAYGLSYYNDLLNILKNEQRYETLPYKCLFDLYLHKLFLHERLKYIQESMASDSQFDSYVVAWEGIVRSYELMNRLNMKYNIKDGIVPYCLATNPQFKEKFVHLVEMAYEEEVKVLPQIIAYLKKKIEKNFTCDLYDFDVEKSCGDWILYPQFHEYISQISVAIESMADPELPVKLQISNGYVYYPESTGNINTYKIYPCKPEWIKITNCTSIKTLHIKKLDDSVPGVLNGALSDTWVPMNHIREWKMEQTQTSFQITGVDPYIVCEKLNLDAQKYPYVTLDYKTNDPSDQAQLYYMTDVSPIYSREKCLTFNLSHSNDRHIYKLDMSQLSLWKSLITSLRLDPVHYPSTYQKEHITSECTIYGISVSQLPFVYNSKEDYAGNQRVNQWEYDYTIAGERQLLSYDPTNKIWGAAEGSHIGVDYQQGFNGISVSRNWIAPSDGTYKVVVSGECDADTEMSVIVDGITVFQNDADNLVYFEGSIQLHIGSIIQIATRKGKFKKINSNIQKVITPLDK